MYERKCTITFVVLSLTILRLLIMYSATPYSNHNNPIITLPPLSLHCLYPTSTPAFFISAQPLPCHHGSLFFHPYPTLLHTAILPSLPSPPLSISSLPTIMSSIFYFPTFTSTIQLFSTNIYLLFLFFPYLQLLHHFSYHLQIMIRSHCIPVMWGKMQRSRYLKSVLWFLM